MLRNYLAIFVSLVTALSFTIAGKNGHPHVGDLIISYKGNMGVLVSAKNQSVLIDGLHEFYREAYLPPPATETEKIFSRKTPYSNLGIALFTHFHKDHYSTSLSKQFLSVDKNNLVIGPSQVVDSLTAGRTINAWNKNGQIFRDTANELHIEAYNIAHTWPERHSSVQNIAYLLKTGQTTLLHIGDADIAPGNFSRFASESITVLIVPVWFLTDKKGIDIITGIIKPKVVIATHISPQETRSLDQYKIPGITTYFFRTINEEVGV